MKHIFSFVLFSCIVSAGLLCAQESNDAAVNPPASEESTASSETDNPGMGALDQATEAKLRASAVSDLSQVILLCQRAKKEGLSGDNLQYCNQLLASTQLQRGLFFSQSLLNPQRQRPNDWTFVRQTALKDLEEAVTIITDHPTAYLRIAQLNLLPDGDENRAKEVLQLAIQHSQDEPTLQLQAIRILAVLEPEPEKREKVLADAAAKGSPEIKLLHALTLVELNRNDDALAALQNLITAESENIELHDRIIATLTGFGKFDLAMSILDRSSEKASGDRKDRIDLMKAELFFKMEQDSKALTLLNSLYEKTKVDNDFKMDLLRLRASIYFTMDDFEKAMADVETADKIRPNYPSVLLLKYNIYMAQKRYEEALEITKKLQSIVPEDPSNIRREIQILSEQEKYDEALGIARRMQRQFPDEPQWVMILIEVYSKQKDFGKALSLAEEQLKAKPEELRWVVAKSQILSEQDKWSEAASWIESCLRKKPDSRELELLLISVLADGKNFKAAKEWTQKLLVKEPENLLVLRLNSQMSISLGHHHDAIETLTKVIELDPADYTSINNLSWIFSTSPLDSVRDGKKALELAEKACEITQYNKAFVVSTLAAAHAEVGNFVKAREWSQKSIDLAKKEKDRSEDEQKELLDNLQKELETFKQDMPFRELIEDQK